MTQEPAVAAGHRARPHTADVIIEAWGPSREACAEEAVRALVETFADVGNVAGTDAVRVQIDAEMDEELLVRLLEEVVYVVEVLGQVPVQIRLTDAGRGGVAGTFETVPVEDVEATGALPKGVSHSDLVFEQRADVWRCHAVVDV
jgi:SHS2 domain-containing protein